MPFFSLPAFVNLPSDFYFRVCSYTYTPVSVFTTLKSNLLLRIQAGCKIEFYSGCLIVKFLYDSICID